MHLSVLLLLLSSGQLRWGHGHKLGGQELSSDDLHTQLTVPLQTTTDTTERSFVSSCTMNLNHVQASDFCHACTSQKSGGIAYFAGQKEQAKICGRSLAPVSLEEYS